METRCALFLADGGVVSAGTVVGFLTWLDVAAVSSQALDAMYCTALHCSQLAVLLRCEVERSTPEAKLR